jgi:succinate-semialdehyde dehydrogenase/glutarate-semialdehyde dehydrogenase
MSTEVREAVRLRLHIGGQWTEAASGETFESASPATGEVLAVVPDAGREDGRRAVEAAGRARKAMAALGVEGRARLCGAIAERIDLRRDEVARTVALEQGKPMREALGEVEFAAGLYRDAAGYVERLETGILPSSDPRKRVLTIRQPHGVVAVITPWNYPVGIPSEYLSAALAAGNTVVWKPAPTTSLVAARLLECMLEAGLPNGACNLLFGGKEAGEEIVSNPGTQAVGFTGSFPVGDAVARQAGAKPLLLELGGNGPTIILDDADLELAVEAAAFGCYSNAGQICQSSERILVTPRAHDHVLSGLVGKAESIRLGHPLDEATTMGPLNNEGVAQKMDEHIADALARGAVVVAGGERASGFPTGLYYRPSVLDQVPRTSLINDEETFGPMAPVISVPDLDEAIEVANSCRYGLCCSVFTGSLRNAFRAAERLECGVVNVNETAAYWDGRTPFGGYSGKASGVGRLGGAATIESMTQLKSIVLDVGA